MRKIIIMIERAFAREEAAGKKLKVHKIIVFHNCIFGLLRWIVLVERETWKARTHTRIRSSAIRVAAARTTMPKFARENYYYFLNFIMICKIHLCDADGWPWLRPSVQVRCQIRALKLIEVWHAIAATCHFPIHLTVQLASWLFDFFRVLFCIFVFTISLRLADSQY